MENAIFVFGQHLVRNPVKDFFCFVTSDHYPGLQEQLDLIGTCSHKLHVADFIVFTITCTYQSDFWQTLSTLTLPVLIRLVYRLHTRTLSISAHEGIAHLALNSSIS